MQPPADDTNHEPNENIHSRRTFLGRTALGTTALALGLPRLAGADDGSAGDADLAQVLSTFAGPVRTLSNPEPEGFDSFGYAVALSADGDTLLVGAPFDGSGGDRSVGEVYAFARTTSGWRHDATLENPDPEARDDFGLAVALSADGETALVSAPGNAADSDVGEAYTFTRTAGGWSHDATLENPDPDENDRFGYAVALSADGRTALVGAPSDPPFTPIPGAAYVFEHDDGGWTPTVLPNPHPDPIDGFGLAVALSADGNAALVGEPVDETGSMAEVGEAHVYTRTAGEWDTANPVTLENPEPETGDRFGLAVAISADGETALVGAPFDDGDAGRFVGEAYVFARAAGGWSHAATLENPEPDGNDRYGNAVAISADGSTALVGALLDESGGGEFVGEAYVFTRTDGTWTPLRLGNPEPDADDEFGSAVALSADASTALVGAPNDDRLAFAITGGPNAGEYPAREGAFTSPIAEEPGDTMAGPTRYVGLACDPASVPPASPGEIAVTLRGDCYFYTKAQNAIDAGYDGLVVFNNAAGGDEVISWSGEPRDIPGVFVGHSTGLAIFDTDAVGDLTVGDSGASVEAVATPYVGEAYTFVLDAFPDPVTLKNGDEVTPVDRDGDGLYEDLDGDGDVDGQDVQLLTRLENDYRKGRIQLTDGQVEVLDFDGDGEFTKADVDAYTETYDL